MNISNSSDYYYNTTEVDFLMPAVTDIIIILLGFPTNSFVIWLVVTGAGNGFAAEFFTLNLSFCEIFFCLECGFDLISYKATNFWIAGSICDAVATTGRPLFQCLICVERYLAVVHPVIFLKLKPLRYRVICSVIAWVAGFCCCGVNFLTLLFDQFDVYYFFILVHLSVFFSIQMFCLMVILIALKQSGPGERRRDQKKENLTKRRAFLLITFTIVTTLVIFLPYLILMSLSASDVMLLCIGFLGFTLAGLLQPLLFLHRVGKLPFIKCR